MPMVATNDTEVFFAERIRARPPRWYSSPRSRSYSVKMADPAVAYNDPFRMPSYPLRRSCAAFVLRALNSGLSSMTVVLV